MRVLDAYTKGVIVGSLLASVLVFLYNNLFVERDINYASWEALKVAIATFGGGLLGKLIFFLGNFRQAYVRVTSSRSEPG